jgi:hypothetical protein
MALAAMLLLCLFCLLSRASVYTVLILIKCTMSRLFGLKSLNKITKTRRKIHFNNGNSDNGGSARGVTGRAPGFRRARRNSDRMADNPPDPH